jgi:hypothetical protein
MALADQDAHHSLGFVNPARYRTARSPRYHKVVMTLLTVTIWLLDAEHVGRFAVLVEAKDAHEGSSPESLVSDSGCCRDLR